jgi:chaperone modulatory protein CbpM
MSIEIPEPSWLDEREELTLEELARSSGLAEAEILELAACGVMIPVDPASPAPTFRAETLVVARRASRLRVDFELDLHGLALALHLLERVRDLEVQLSGMRARHSGWR